MLERRERRGRIACLREERVRRSVRGRDHRGESEVEERSEDKGGYSLYTRVAYIKRSTGVERAEGLAFHSSGVHCTLSKCVDEPNLKIICRQGRGREKGEGKARRKRDDNEDSH